MVGSTAPFPFWVEYRQQAAAPALDKSCFGALGFGQHTVVDATDRRRLTLALPWVDAPAWELWHSAEALFYRQAGEIEGWLGEAFAFVRVLVEESRYEGLANASEALYRQLFAQLQRWGYPYPLRLWNYFPAINAPEAGLERYRAFCLGRHRAYEAAPAAIMPAACAIGSLGEGLLIYLIAARESGLALENPRQLSAYHYPKRYGPKSPTFARSLLKTWGNEGGAHLYLSGTASIVGHQTQHPDDLWGQVGETLTNLATLLRQGEQRLGRPLRLAQLKVYWRHPQVALRSRLAAEIVRVLGPAPLLLLQGDICRSDLLIEIDGMATSP